ncbi:MAG TPA: glycerophosphodiester phosphodiesterase family protein [Candidatus Limiplasma sp.]|nr:glycerophosphodiester phosphodiesterase family protein [Candidatus Limiplasma sp.]
MLLVLWILFVLEVILLLFALYLLLIAPASKPFPAKLRTDVLYAHRGLHDGNQDVIENSMKAFRLAIEHGYGMEMDLQSTRDGLVVVFHDNNTKRVCGTDAVIDQTDYADLPLLPDGTPIPLFEDFLKLVDGKVPLIIELKSHTTYLHTVQTSLAMLKDYHGDYCMESFHPVIVKYLRKHAPNILRGQLSSGKISGALKPFSAFMLKNLLVNVLSRPHFIAYDFHHDHKLSLKLNRIFFKPLFVAWTIRSQEDLDAALKRYDAVIFEKFIPRQP